MTIAIHSVTDDNINPTHEFHSLVNQPLHCLLVSKVRSDRMRVTPRKLAALFDNLTRFIRVTAKVDNNLGSCPR
jgi:hypothetical protein